jgi:hypothetical protein
MDSGKIKKDKKSKGNYHCRRDQEGKKDNSYAGQEHGCAGIEQHKDCCKESTGAGNEECYAPSHPASFSGDGNPKWGCQNVIRRGVGASEGENIPKGIRCRESRDAQGGNGSYHNQIPETRVETTPLSWRRKWQEYWTRQR